MTMIWGGPRTILAILPLSESGFAGFKDFQDFWGATDHPENPKILRILIQTVSLSEP
jgi:hypothetical protein